MQKNKKTKKSMLRKMAPFVVAAAGAAGYVAGAFYLLGTPADFNQDGAYSHWEYASSGFIGGVSLAASLLAMGVGGEYLYNDLFGRKDRSSAKARAGSDGHVKSV